MRTGTGGQLDFVVGAFWSRGGRAINLVPSTTLNDTVSRIVPYISWGARVTVPRHYAGFIVTEYGAADLYGRTEPERAEELIKVAHPKFREELEKAGRNEALSRRKPSEAEWESTAMMMGKNGGPERLPRFFVIARTPAATGRWLERGSVECHDQLCRRSFVAR